MESRLATCGGSVRKPGRALTSKPKHATPISNGKGAGGGHTLSLTPGSSHHRSSGGKAIFTLMAPRTSPV